MSKVWILVIIVVVVAAGAYYMMGNKSQPYPAEEMVVTEETMTESPTTSVMESSIQLAEQNDSSQSGTAVLTENNGKVTVTLNVTGGASGVAQPAHIHAGACPDVGAVAYPLTDVVDGQSETVLDVSLADLAGKQPLGINVHKSAKEVKVYVACGDLNLPSSAPAVSTGDTKMKY